MFCSLELRRRRGVSTPSFIPTFKPLPSAKSCFSQAIGCNHPRKSRFPFQSEKPATNFVVDSCIMSRQDSIPLNSISADNVTFCLALGYSWGGAPVMRAWICKSFIETRPLN